MTLARVTKWFNSLPIEDQDLPLLIVDEIAYSPRFALQEVSKGTQLGNKLQILIEGKRFSSNFQQEVNLAIQRLITILSKYPPDKTILVSIGIGSKAYTPRELIQEIQNQTKVGMVWINNEITHMRNLMQV